MMNSTTSSQHCAQVVVVTDKCEKRHELEEILGGICSVRVHLLSNGSNAIADSTLCLVVDADLASERVRAGIRPISSLARSRELPVFFVFERNAEKGKLEKNVKLAFECGATNYAIRPFSKKAILNIMPSGTRSALQGNEVRDTSIPTAATTAAQSVLTTIFETARVGATIKFETVIAQDNIILDALKGYGIRAWLETVRSHHNRTYEHSLLVTGVAVAFAQKLGIRRRDQKRVAHAALVHDIGKAFISLDILDKPGKLTIEEMGAIKEHPVLGHQSLVAQGGFPDEVLDCVLHHHELLDGSGYPHGLKEEQISDLVRIITIADIFSALIERRSYKPPLPAERALEIMQNMSGKLDPDLLREFRAVALEAE